MKLNTKSKRKGTEEQRDRERCGGGNITNITFLGNHGGCADF
jgi:hypothetical protein